MATIRVKVDFVRGPVELQIRILSSIGRLKLPSAGDSFSVRRRTPQRLLIEDIPRSLRILLSVSDVPPRTKQEISLVFKQGKDEIAKRIVNVKSDRGGEVSDSVSINLMNGVATNLTLAQDTG